MRRSEALPFKGRLWVGMGSSGEYRCWTHPLPGPPLEGGDKHRIDATSAASTETGAGPTETCRKGNEDERRSEALPFKGREKNTGSMQKALDRWRRSPL
jgi:hypothetical protein